MRAKSSAVAALAGETPFGEAMATVASGAIPVGTGYGWIDLRGLDSKRRDAALAWAARALGPGGSGLVDDRHEIGRRTGVELETATQLLSAAASYTLGVRIDGVETRSARRALASAASRRRSRGGWELLDLGRPSSIPLHTAAEPFGPFGSRGAATDRSLVLARSDQIRDDLIGSGDPPLDDPAFRLAVACLGDVVAARIVPNNFTHAPNHGPDLLAFGVAREPANPATESRPASDSPREVLCAVDSDEQPAASAADALREALASDAVDEVTKQPIGELVSASETVELDGGDAHAARSELVLAPGVRAGLLFGAFVRGSMLTYVGLPAPVA